MRGRIYLHIGTHKTGTTFIQESFARHSDALRRGGLLYPTMRPSLRIRNGTSQLWMAHALARLSFIDRAKLWAFRRALDRDMLGMKAGLISAEAIYRHVVAKKEPLDTASWFTAHEAYLVRIAGYLEGYEIVPIVYFRGTEDFIVSLYKESIARGRQDIGLSLEEFVERRAPLLAYSQHVEQLQKCFGRVIVRSYEEARKGGLLNDMAAQVGAEPELFAKRVSGESATVRQSVGNRAVCWLRRALKEGHPSTHRRRMLFASRTGGEGTLVDDRTSMLWKSPETRSAFVTRFAASAEYVGIAPDLSKELRPVVWTDEDQCATNAAFERWERENASLLARRESLGLMFYEADR